MDNAGNSVFTEFPVLSVYPQVGISRSASETYDRFYLFHLQLTEVRDCY